MEIASSSNEIQPVQVQKVVMGKQLFLETLDQAYK